jgi:translation initiation factor IF-1
MESDSQLVHLDGVVEEALPGLMFRVTVSPNGVEKKILAHLAGKMKIHYIRIIPGDRVVVEMPNVRDSRGRIIRRY